MIETHIIPGDAILIRRDRRDPDGTTYRALCGRVVEYRQHKLNGEPSCPECKRIEAEDMAHAKAKGWI